MSTNGVLSVKYVTLPVALVLVCLWNTELREKLSEGTLMSQGSSVTDETGHGLKGQGSIPRS